MTQVDPDIFGAQFTSGNAGAAPAGMLTNASTNASAPLQIIIGAQTPPKLATYIRGLTPDDLSVMLVAFRRGMLRAIVPAWDTMAERDGHLLSVIAKRMGRVAALEWKVLPIDDSPEAQQQAEFLRDFLQGIPSFDTRLEELSQAIKTSISGHEIEWLPGAGKDGRITCRLWPQNTEDFDLTAGRPRIYVKGQLTELPPDKFLVHRLAMALMVPSSILYVMKMISAGQWLSFGEKFGMPGIIGNAPASASQDDIDKFYEMLCAWSQEFCAAIREGYTVTTITASGGNGPLTYPQMIEWADKENSKIWTGHTVTTDGQSGSGTLAGEGAADQMDDLVNADGVRLSRAIEQGLCEPAVRFEFGQPLLVRFAMQAEKPMTPADKATEVTTDVQLVNELGLILVEADVYAKYGWRKPEANEAVIMRKPQADPGIDPLTGLPHSHGATAFKATERHRAFEALAMETMLAPLKALIEQSGEMSDTDLRQAIVALKLPADGFAQGMGEILLRAMKAGEEEVLDNARRVLRGAV